MKTNERMRSSESPDEWLTMQLWASGIWVFNTVGTGHKEKCMDRKPEARISLWEDPRQDGRLVSVHMEWKLSPPVEVNVETLVREKSSEALPLLIY